MKRKFSKILGVGLTLALLISLLATAAPVSANVTSASVSLDDDTISYDNEFTVTFAVTDELNPTVTELSFQEGSSGGTAEWSATEAHSGKVSAYLSDGGTGYDTDTDYYGRVVVDLSGAAAIPLADLLTAGDLSYWFNYFDDVSTGYPDAFPYMILEVDSGGGIVGDGFIVLLSGGESYAPAQDTWVYWDIDEWDSWFGAGAVTGVGTLADFDGNYVNADVLAVKVAVGEWHTGTYTPITGYVDDITVDGTTYDEGGTITIEFPLDFVLTAITDAADIDVTVGASSGIGRIAFGAANSLSATDGQELNILVPDDIGAGATVQVVIGQTNPVVNAPGLGDYVLKVSTSAETTKVDSATFTLIAPDISPVPGVVKGYNAAGVQLYEKTGDTAINAAITTTGVVTIEVGPGTYDEDVIVNTADDQVIKSTGGAAVTIIADGTISGGTVTISKKVTFDGFTVEGILQTTGVADSTVKNNVLQGSTGADVDIATALTDNTYEVGTGEVGINVASGITATVSGGTFNVTGEGIVNDGTLTLSGATLTGATGVGIRNTANGTATITGTTFGGLDMALDIDAGTVNIQTSTITGVGNATTPTPAINVDTATLVIILNNTITDSVDEILNVAADEDKVFMNFNTITNPAKGITSAAASVDATNNLWDGGVAPTVTSTNATTSPYLTTAASNPSIVIGADTLDAKATAGVKVATTTADAIAVANYAANPSTVDVPGVASAYFDVYVSGTPGDTTIMLYGTVGAGTKAYVWGAGLGEWVPASDQAVNVFAGSVTVTVTASTIPSISDLVGLPFAIADPTPTTVIATAPEIVMPKAGAVDIVLRPTFDWLPVAGADGYYFQLADNPLFAPPLLISFEGDLGRLLAVQTAYTYVPGLDDYATAYHWRVKAVSGTIGAGDLLESAWVENVFITMDEPVEVLPPVVVEETPDVVLEPADIIVTLPPATPITPSWIYVIIAVGAVLVIALLVLIVRTRRVA